MARSTLTGPRLQGRPAPVLVVAPPVQATVDPLRRRVELKQFLRAKRAGIRPEQLGLSAGTRRLTPGLRREEVALAADVGHSWYTWLEQGRTITISAAALSRVAAVLRLTEADSAYLFWLAGVPHPHPVVFAGAVPPAISAMLQTYQGPAVILSPAFDLIAANDVAEQLFEFREGVEPFPNNQLWQLFMSAKRRSLYAHYDADVRHFVALFRLTSASLVGLPGFQRLCDALTMHSPLFRTLWSQQQTQGPTPYSTTLQHATIGKLRVFSCRLAMQTPEGAYLMMLSPADSDTAAAFARLASPANYLR